MKTNYLARQPIFDKHQELYAYELLFRHDADAQEVQSLSDSADAHMLLNSLTSQEGDAHFYSGPLFINMSENLVRDLAALNIHKDNIVLEVLEDVLPHEELVTALAQLKHQGYLIALDDFVFSPEKVALLELADIVKIDVKQHSITDIPQQLELIKKFPVQLLAEKIETKIIYRTCIDLGFDYFQGFFLARPQMIEHEQHNTHQALATEIERLQDQSLPLQGLQQLIAQDAYLSDKIQAIYHNFYATKESVALPANKAIHQIPKQSLPLWLNMIARSIATC